MLDARCERVFLVENAGKDVESYSIVGLGEAEIFPPYKGALDHVNDTYSSVIIPAISTMSTRT